MAHFPDLTRTLCGQFARRLRETNAALSQLRESLAMHVVNTVAGQGEQIFYKGDPCDALYVLADGAVELDGPGGFQEIRPSGHGPCFLNAAAFLRRGPHTHSARATTVSVLNTIPIASREAAIRNFPQLVDALL
jgi:CRP-like cAMP-binding protein